MKRLLVQTRGVEIGGNETVLRSLLRGLGELGWQCLLICPPGPVRSLLAPHVSRTFAPPVDGRQWQELLERLAPDAAVFTCATALLPGAALCRARRVPVLWIYHCPQRAFLESHQLYGPALACVDALVTPSRYLMEELAPPAPLVRHVIPNGIDDVQFAPRSGGREIRRRLAIPPDAFVLGYSARFEHRKRHDFLLKAFARFHRRHPGTHLLLLGRNERHGRFPDTSARVWGEIQRLGLSNHVHWVAAHPDAVPEFLSAVDLFCFPPVGEAQGCALLEAMAMGVPVAAVNADGLRELFRAGAPGYTAPAHDLTAFLRILELAYRHRHRLGELASAGRDFVLRRHGFDSMIRAYQNTLLGLTLDRTRPLQ